MRSSANTNRWAGSLLSSPYHNEYQHAGQRARHRILMERLCALEGLPGTSSGLLLRFDKHPTCLHLQACLPYILLNLYPCALLLRSCISATPGQQCQSNVQAVEEMNRQTGARVNPDALPDDMMSNSSNTRGLMSAVSQLPALIERKRTIEKHTSILHKLLEARLLALARASQGSMISCTASGSWFIGRPPSTQA